MEEFAFQRALSAIWEFIGAVNRYVDAQAPWALAKTDPARQGTVLYVTAEVIRQVAILVGRQRVHAALGEYAKHLRKIDASIGVGQRETAFHLHNTFAGDGAQLIALGKLSCEHFGERGGKPRGIGPAGKVL